MTITPMAQDGRVTIQGCLQGEAPRAKLSEVCRQDTDLTMKLGVSYCDSQMSHQVYFAMLLQASPDRLFVP